ncbi:hypothetical protein DXG03_002595 [Asterophora parasitica]|uniref:Uncharacterized protein n=1 Tax=Asterophora parasitica TaxID=117018 RepID=A0A9P7G8N0_9AGAR|nr:hypothetical protein DXG03_002595 [Asterophora parasitica]
MSASTTTTIAATEPGDERLTFPPFPQPPSGVSIVPFKAFKESGIQILATDPNDDRERDGHGIPTVELRVKHNTDSSKTEATRKRKAKVQPNASRPAPGTMPGVRREWYDIWNDNEELKRTGPYNPLGIRHFRLFVGLLSNTPVWTRTDKPPQENDSDDDDDETSFATQEVDTQRGPGKPPPRVRARPPYALYGVEPTPVGSDEEVKALLNGENARREEQMVEFLNDPEGWVKTFLSSYMRKQGLIWTDRNLINFPILLSFFIRFILRNRVFPEPEFERAFKRSMEVIELAQKELILTSKIAKQIPDDFSRAARGCWGQKADGYKSITIIEEEEEKNATTATEEETVDEGNPEHEAKRAKLDPDTAAPADEAQVAVDRFERELKAANVETIKVDELLADTEKLQGIQDNLNPDIDTLPAWATDDPSSSGGWGASTSDAWPADNGDDDPWNPVDVEWAPVAPTTFFPWLGPSALPLTHTTGIIECSVRRIKSFTAPLAPATIPKSAVSADEDPDAVDAELERHFAKVVLGPWTDWDVASNDAPHMAVPRILESSRGRVSGVVGTDGKVEAALVDGDGSNGDGKDDATQEGVKPHDPLNDDITLLVEPALLPMLSVGIGLGGTWVQIAREDDFGGEKKKKKKKGKAKKVATRYWYVDELMLTLPSFHT